jgi:HEAT repeats
MTPRSDRLARLTLALVVLGAFGCRRTAPGSVAPAITPAAALPLLGEVTLQDATPSNATPPASIDFAGMQEPLRGRLIASGLFASAAADAGEVGVVRVRAEVALDGAEVEDKGVARAAVRIRFDTRPSDAPGAIEEELAGQGEQVYPIAKTRAAAARGKPGAANAKSAGSGESGAVNVDKRALFSRLVLRVAGDLIDGFAARERLRTASVPAIHVALRGDGGELQEQAIRIAGERKLRDEVPVLLELLDNPNESVRDAALGALIQIGDRRAVTTLAKSRSLHDRREMRKILDAIATLGGDEAHDYLSFVAASHDDEEIRALAAAAKLRLERRQQAPASP